MRLIDADALMDDIKRDSKKAIDEGDKVGSFWLGYAAGVVIKQPTVQPELDSENLVRTIENGITATNSRDAYSLGMRNGMRWCKSLIDGAEPKFEYGATRVDDGTDSADLPPAQSEPQWIPIERELPRDGSWNIFTDGKNISVERYKADTIDHFFPNGRWFQLEDVIAWMPLPEPYRKGADT